MTEKAKNYKPATQLLHAGHTPDSDTGSRAVPIYQTTSYMFNSVQHAADLFDIKAFGHIYTRLSNPTTAVLEDRLAALHGGSGALATASGTAAIVMAVLNITQAGQNIVSSNALYGGTHNLFEHTLPKMGIEARLVDVNDPAAFAAAIDDKTRLLYTETIGNPKNSVPDLAALADIAHKNHIPLVVDNTVAPLLCNPFDHGADIVVYSLTKFFAGHGNSIGGAIVDSGTFDWTTGNFPELTTPDPSYHDEVWTDKFGLTDDAVLPGAAYIIKARLQLLRDLGACLSPLNAFLILQGAETLHLRMPAHCDNALAAAQWLEKHPKVSWVNYPGLDSHADHAMAKKYLTGGFGGIIGFGIKGGKAAGVRFIESVKLCSHLANIGDARSLVIHPASTTHAQLTPEQQEQCGVTEDFIRFSVGLEAIEDILADLDQALNLA